MSSGTQERRESQSRVRGWGPSEEEVGSFYVKGRKETKTQ